MFHDRLVAHLDSLDGSFIVSEEAEKFLAKMAEHHPDELDAWLSERHVLLIAEEMRALLRSQRARDRAHAGSRAFAEHYSLDDTPTAGDAFGVRYCIDDGNVWKNVAEMTGDDHRYVAGRYELTGRRALVRAAFHEAVARRIGAKRTADVLSVEQYERLRKDIEGE